MKLLIAEDNLGIAELLQRALREEGHMSDIQTDGHRALRQALVLNYDVILLDLTLSGPDSISVCRALRDRGCNGRILVLSARAEPDEKILGLDAGADDYVAKPFDLGELLARVRALGRRGTSTGCVVKVGPLTLDRLEREATIDGKRVTLTEREFDLLSYLALAHGRTIPRKQLFRNVWGSSFDPGSNIIDAHITKIRQKLGAFGKLIETSRGIGYRVADFSAAA